MPDKRGTDNRGSTVLTSSAYCAILSQLCHRAYCDMLCLLGCHNKPTSCHTKPPMTYYAYCSILCLMCHKATAVYATLYSHAILCLQCHTTSSVARGGGGGYSPPIGLPTKMHNKENTTFLALLRLSFALDWTKK